MPEVDRGRPGEQGDLGQDEEHGQHHEGDAAVRAGHLRDVLVGEARVLRAHPRGQADEGEAHDDDGGRAQHLQRRRRAQQLVGDDRQGLRQAAGSGGRPIQNFDHRKRRMLSGELRTSQKAGPSAETAGKTKRTATADSTKAAMARLTNA